VYGQVFYWKDIVAKTTPESTDYWYTLASKPERGTGPVPFAACYVRGEYIVVEVAPDADISSKVSVGCKVSKINGIPVDEYVASGRGTRHLYYDPEFRKLYDAPRLRFFPPFTWSSAEYVDLGGKTVAGDIPVIAESVRFRDLAGPHASG